MSERDVYYVRDPLHPRTRENHGDVQRMTVEMADGVTATYSDRLPSRDENTESVLHPTWLAFESRSVG